MVSGKYSLLRQKLLTDWRNHDYFVLLNTFKLDSLNFNVSKSYYVKSSYLNSILNANNDLGIKLSGNVVCVFLNSSELMSFFKLLGKDYIVLYFFRKNNCYDNREYYALKQLSVFYLLLKLLKNHVKIVYGNEKLLLINFMLLEKNNNK